MAGIGLDDRDDVIEMQTVLSVFHKLGNCAERGIHLPFGANVVSIASAVIADLQILAGLVHCNIVPREAIGKLVGIDKIGMSRDPVAEALDVSKGLFHLFLAAESRLNGEKLRECAVMTSKIPTDELKLAFFDASFVKSIGNIAHAGKIAGDVNGRLIFGGLMFDGRGALLPSHSDTD